MHYALMTPINVSKGKDVGKVAVGLHVIMMPRLLSESHAMSADCALPHSSHILQILRRPALLCCLGATWPTSDYSVVRRTQIETTTANIRTQNCKSGLPVESDL